MSVVIKVDNVSKYYRLGVIGGGTLREDVNNWIARLRGKPDPLLSVDHSGMTKRKQGQIWALNKIDMEVEQGEILGIIGHNGAGKSTLLKILSRITAPTTGEIKIKGRVGSLLEVGTGFHPELTGRENVYLNGAILGMSRAEVKDKLDEIVEFAQVSQFIDTPVKRYSSGMVVRLAFSVAAHLEPEILIVDEVLAVGDQRFQEKCIGKLGDISSQGRTILFVSHNLSTLSKLCTRIVVIDHGEVVYNGNVEEGISTYYNKLTNKPVLLETDFSGELYPRISFEQIRINDQAFIEGTDLNPLDQINFTVTGNSTIDLERYHTVFSVRKNGQLVFSLYDCPEPAPLKSGKFQSQFSIPAKFLFPGDYTCSFGGIAEGDIWLWTRDYIFRILHCWGEGYDTTSTVKGIVNIDQTGNRTAL